eukprot:3544947-Prymnesium_polylepis.1
MEGATDKRTPESPHRAQAHPLPVIMMRAVWLRWSFRVTSLRSTLQPGITTFSEHRALLDETKIISDRLRTTFCGLNGDCPGSPDATRHVVARQP